MKMTNNHKIFCRILALVIGLSTFCYSVFTWGKEEQVKVAVKEYFVQDRLSNGGYPQQDVVTDAGVKPVEVKKRKNQIIVTTPGKLTQSDTEYILTEDVTADATAFTIEASSITLNLNGHSIKYLQGKSSGAYGIALSGSTPYCI